MQRNDQIRAGVRFPNFSGRRLVLQVLSEWPEDQRLKLLCGGPPHNTGTATGTVVAVCGSRQAANFALNDVEHAAKADRWRLLRPIGVAASIIEGAPGPILAFILLSVPVIEYATDC